MRKLTAMLVLLFALPVAAGFAKSNVADSDRKSKLLERELDKRRLANTERKRLVTMVERYRNRLPTKWGQNEKWYTEAEKKEFNLAEKADKYLEKQSFRKAKKYYKKALGITFYQWIITKDPTKDQLDDEDFVPLTKRKKFRPATEKTAWVYQKLMEIDRLMLENDLLKRRARADKAYKAGKLSNAYQYYGTVLQFAAKMGGNTLAATTAQEVKDLREDIIETVSKPLQEAEDALEGNRPAAAFDTLKEFKEKHGSFNADKTVRDRFKKLAADPAVRQEKRKRDAVKQLELGKAATARRDYLSAQRRFQSAVKNAPATDVGKAAAMKLREMMADENIVKVIKLQEAEFECKGLLARARMLAKQEKAEEAIAVYDSIIKTHPNTPWAKEAATAKEALKKETAAE